MNYTDFAKMVENDAEHETIYQDSEGRLILVIRVLDAFGLVTRAIHAEREACARVCEHDVGMLGKGEAGEFWTYMCAKAIRARGEKPYATQAAEVEISTSGRMRVDPLTGDVSIGTAKIKAEGKT